MCARARMTEEERKRKRREQSANYRLHKAEVALEQFIHQAEAALAEAEGRALTAAKVNAVAHHEAGHAVVSRSLGAGVRYVSISDQVAGRAGVCVGYKSATARDGSGDVVMIAAQKQVCIFFAGQIAEARFTNHNPERWSHEADDGGAVELAIRACGSTEEADALLAWLFVRTRNKVAALWYQIEAVAGELAARGRLTGAELDAVIQASILARAATHHA